MTSTSSEHEPLWLLKVGVVIVSTIITCAVAYGMFIDKWYWKERAQIVLNQPAPAEFQTSPACPRNGVIRENGVFPEVDELLADNFRCYNDKYIGLHQFWGDDVISNFFANISRFLGKRFTEWFYPWYVDSFVPWWNRTMEPDSMREAVAWAFVAFAAVFGYIAKNWVSDVYGFLKRRHHEKRDSTV